jgi:hypothetical protein
MAKSTTTSTYRLANGEIVTVTGATEVIGQQTWESFVVAGQAATVLADGSTLSVSAADGAVTDVAGNGAQAIADYSNTSDTILGNNGGDTISDNRSGGTGGDSFSGGTSKDTLQDLGTAAVDSYRDVFFGANGADVLAGGNGKDILIGGLGSDSMSAGAGATTFNYYTNTGSQVSDSPYAAGGPAAPGTNVPWDVVTGFRHGTDHLDFGAGTTVGAISLGSGVANLVAALTGPGWKGSLVWVGAGGSDADAGVANALHAHAAWQDAACNFVYADINGDGRADLKIQVNGAHLGAADFNGAVADPGPVFTAPTTFAVDEDTTSGVLAIGVAPPNAGDSVAGPVTITGLPSDATFSSAADPGGVTHNQDGSWTVALGALADLRVNAGEDVNATLTLSATDAYGFASAKTIALTVNPVPEAPTVTLAQTSLTLDEDGTTAVRIGLSTSDADDVADHVTISGAPADASFTSAADAAGITHNADGTWTIATGALGDLMFKAGEDGSATLHVTGSTSGPESATSADQTIAVTINPVAEAPTVTLAQPTLSVDEHANVALGVSMTAHDGDDVLDHVTVTGVPSDATLASLSDAQGVVHNQDGSWTIAPGALADLTLTAGEDGTATLHVTGTSSGVEGATSVDQTIALTVNAVPEAPLVMLANATVSVNEGAGVALGIAMTALDGDDTLDHVTITGAPPDATLASAADAQGVVHNADGSWTIAPGALGDLMFTAGEDGNATLHVTGTTSGTEGATSADQTIAVTINPVAEAPTVGLAQPTLSVNEGASVALGVSMTAHDDDDVLDHVTITGAPADASFTSAADAAGITHNADGSWTIATGALGDLMFKAGEDGSATLHVTGSTSGPESATSADQTIAVTINPVAEAPTVTVASTTLNATAGTPVALGIGMTAQDSDDVLDHVTISGVPAGATLSSSTDAQGVTLNPDGSWTIAPGALPDLVLTGTTAGTATLHVTGSTSGAEGAASADQTIALSLTSADVESAVSIAFTMNVANLSNLTSNGALAQNQSMGTVLATGDADDAFTYALGSGTDAGGHAFDTTHFALSSSGQLSTAGIPIPAATYYLKAVATDSDAAPNQSAQEFIVWVDGNTGDTANFSTSTLPVLAYAMGGSDSVSGSSAGNSLFGGLGNDVLVGGAGNDVLVGGAGGDQLTGGGGANTFAYLAAGDSTAGTNGGKANFDTIADFVASGTVHDTIDTSQIAAITTIQGATTGTVNAHSIAWVISGGNAVVYANTSGSAETIGATHGAPDMEIHLAGVTSLSASDFAHA